MTLTIRFRLLPLAAVAALLGLSAAAVSRSAAASGRSAPPRQGLPHAPVRAALPVLHLVGGPPRSLDNLWLGFSELFLEVNAGLTHIIPGGGVAPDLATWTLSRNRLVYTFTIRANARFSNGDAVTARDAVFSLDRFLTPGLGSDSLVYFGLIRGARAFNAGSATSISGVKVLGRRTLQISITHPAVYFPMTLANYSAVFDPAVITGKTLGNPADEFQTGYLSTTCTANQGAGPFRFVCHDQSSNIDSFYAGNVPTYTLEPNPYYYGPKPHVTLEYRTYPDVARAYRENLVDASGHLPSLVTGADRYSRQYSEFPSSMISFLTPNVHLAPFDNVNCRLAVAYALDRGALAGQVPSTIWRPAYTIVPPGIPGHYPGSGDPHYSLARARSALARCPERTTPVALTYPDLGGPGNTEGASIVRMLNDAGFTATLKLIPTWKYHRIVTEPLDQTQTQVAIDGWAEDYPDPQDYCSLLLHSGTRFNVGGWSDAAFDRLVDRADRLESTARRSQLYIRAQHIALGQGALIPLSYKVAFALIKPWVHELFGTETYNWLMPRDFDWSRVTVDMH